MSYGRWSSRIVTVTTRDRASVHPRPPAASRCDGVPLAGDRRRASGTPVYVYSGAAIRAPAIARSTRPSRGYPHALHYALKANSSLAVRAAAPRASAARADANSVGEIDVALRAGFAPGDIVFTGVGKTAAELECAAALGSAGDQRRVGRASWRASTRSPRAAARAPASPLRVNPDIDARSHPHISTGLQREQVRRAARRGARRCSARIAARPALQLGRRARPHRVADHRPGAARGAPRDGRRRPRAARSGADGIAPRARRRRRRPRHLVRRRRRSPTPAEYAAALVRPVRQTPASRSLLEPGRAIVGRRGASCSRASWTSRPSRRRQRLRRRSTPA